MGKWLDRAWVVAAALFVAWYFDFLPAWVPAWGPPWADDEVTAPTSHGRTDQSAAATDGPHDLGEPDRDYLVGLPGFEPGTC